MHPERIHPEAIRSLRVASRDVSSHALAEPELGKQTKGGRQPLFAVQSLFCRGLKRGALRVTMFMLPFLLPATGQPYIEALNTRRYDFGGNVQWVLGLQMVADGKKIKAYLWPKLLI